MIQSYFTTAARNFRKNKLHTLINITGLGLGMMATILAILFIVDENSFDQFHAKRDRIYRVNKIFVAADKSESQNGESSGKLGPAMAEDFPEVEKVVRYHPWFSETVVSFENNKIVLNEADIVFVDSSFFDVFDFKLLSGNPKTALTRPSTIVITKELARSLFGEQDPIGKTIVGISNLEFEVTGVVEEAPRNSHIQFKGLISWTTTVPQMGPEPLQFEWMNNWIAQGVRTYVLLKEGTDPKAVDEKFSTFMQAHSPDRADRYKPYLQKFSDMYLKSYDVTYANLIKSGNQQYVNLFSIIAGFVLVIAGINYVNISTSKSTRRAKEVGLRKTMGASKGQLVNQFLGESFLIVAFSALLGILLAYLAIPFFNDLAGKSLPAEGILNTNVIGAIIVLVFIVALVAGIYPSFVISSFTPAEVLRASGKSRITGNWPRYVLITFQFSVSIIMIAATVIVYQQINFIMSKDLGFDKDHVLVVQLTDEIINRKQVFQNTINELPGVVSTSVGRTALSKGSSSTYVVPEGFNPDEVEIRMFPVDGNFLKTFGLEMQSGRFFDPTRSSDSSGLIINEALVKRLGWDDPLRKTIKFNPDEPSQQVIGVLKDFNFKSLYEKVEPLVMWISTRKPNYISVRFNGNPAPIIANLEREWKTYESRYPFNYSFLDESYAQSYASEEKLFKTVITFAGLSVLIACLGLYGLVSFTIEQRTKEFGIRKVLGATVSSLNFLVNKKFIFMVLMAGAIAIPILIPFMEKWLRKFAFQIDVGPTAFIVAIGLTLVVTILAVSVHALKVASANPASSLRHE